MILNDAACVPVCKLCREQGRCDKAIEVPASENIRANTVWAPNLIPVADFPCGCRGIPWPVVHKLGENFDTVTCDKHGPQKLTKQRKKDWIAAAKRHAAEAEKLRSLSYEEAMIYDPPPY